MSYDAIMYKLSSTALNLNPHMQDVIQRVRETGLHKAAAPLYGMHEVTLKTAVDYLGTALIQQHLKHQKIASGIDSYAVLTGEKTAGLKDIWGALRGASKARATPAVGNLAGKLEPMGKAVHGFGTGGLAAPMTWDQHIGHTMASYESPRALYRRPFKPINHAPIPVPKNDALDALTRNWPDPFAATANVSEQAGQAAGNTVARKVFPRPKY